MKIFTLEGSYTIEEGNTTIDRKGRKWESLLIEGAQRCPVGKETVNEIEEEELNEIMRKEGLI